MYAESGSLDPTGDVVGVPEYFVTGIQRIEGMGPCARFIFQAALDGETNAPPIVALIIPIENVPAQAATALEWVTVRARRTVKSVLAHILS
jgi:hypothetical protein